MKLMLYAIVATSAVAVSACGAPEGGTSTAEGEDKAAACEDFATDIERLWNDAEKGRVHAAVSDAGGDSPEGSAEAVITRVDELSHDWVLLKERFCKDAVIRQTITKEAYFKVSACLDNWLMSMRAIVRSLESAEGASAERATAALDNLKLELDACVQQALGSAAAATQ